VFDQTVADTICSRLANGEGLRTICKTEGMPDPRTIYRWLEDNEPFRQQYARSRELQADTLFDEILEIADDAQNDWVEREHFQGDDKSPQLNGEAVARARLRIDSRKWMAGKLRPKKYGETVDINTTVGLTDPLQAVLTQVAQSGMKLVSSTKTIEHDDHQS
jgi:histidinol phosphatase-like PHP family hydrolase